MVIVVVKCFDDPTSMDRCRRHNEEMENLMGATPYVESARFDRFGDARAVAEGPNDEQETFEEVVRHPTLSVHLRDTEELDAVEERRETRQASEDEGADAEGPVAKTLEPRVEKDDDG